MTSASVIGDQVSERLARTLALFDIQELRPEQDVLIQASLAGKDIFGILPTGYGKSACYQIPGIVLGVRSIIVSPLIALQEDQVQMLRKRNIHAFALHSNLDELKRTAIRFYYRTPRPGIPSFLYVSPETLLSREFAALLEGVQFDRIAVDEAHCASTWGNSFRPDYQRIGDAIERMKIPHRSAFTATVDAQIERDITMRIPLREGYVRVEADPQRPNLNLRILNGIPGVSPKTHSGRKKFFQFGRLLMAPEYAGPTIVYCRTKNWSFKLYDLVRKTPELRAMGYTPYLFHGDLGYDDKQMALAGFLSDRRPLVFATSAFGLGIDRADIRQIIHYTTPFTLIDYAQQIGRGGRDGMPTLCTTFHNAEEYLDRQLTKVSRELPTFEFVERILNSIHRVVQSLAPDKRKTYSIRAYLQRTAAMVEANTDIKLKARYLQRIASSVAMLQRVGLVAAGPAGLEAHPVRPGTPPHRELLELTRMHERMMVREQERMAEFFGAETHDQTLLWKLIRTE